MKIEATIAPCARKITLACDRCYFRFDDEFMKSLQFDAFWKRGFDQSEAELGGLNEEVSHNLGPTAKLWKYEFSVNSKDVPLTESLIVVLQASDGMDCQ